MEKNQSKTRKADVVVISIVVAVILIAIGGLVYYLTSSDSVKTNALVQISKDNKKMAVISDAEYNYKLLNLMAQFQQAYGITDEQTAYSFWSTPIDGVAQIDYFKNFALEQIKYEKIEYLKALESGTKLSAQEKEELKSGFDNIEKQLKDQGVKIDDYLINYYGISFRIYKEMSEQSRIASKFSTTQINSIEVTDEDIINYYDENFDRYYTVRVRHILLRTKDDNGNALSEDDIEEKRELANSLLAAINSGEDMDTLVADHSEDPGAEDNSGYYDVTKGSSYVAEFRDWAMASQVGDAAVVESELGYHVMKTYRTTVFEDIILQVKKDLQTARYSEKLSGWLGEYDIVVYEAVYESINPLAS